MNLRALLAGGLAVFMLAGARVHAKTPPQTQPSALTSGELLHKADESRAAHSFDPTDSYELRKIEGWPVRVNKRLLNDEPDLAAKTLELLRFQLYQIPRVVPAAQVEKLRRVTIWVEKSDPLFPCMCYHHEIEWVTKHGLNPEKAHGVELSNPKNFLAWTHEQPWMVLHELAHAFHDQVLSRGFDNPEILAAYHDAMDQKLYDAVLRFNGRTEHAYAMTNQMEYFSECSEAFFGTNDFYPFVRTEFKNLDPKGYEAVRKAWGMEK